MNLELIFQREYQEKSAKGELQQQMDFSLRILFPIFSFLNLIFQKQHRRSSENFKLPYLYTRERLEFKSVGERAWIICSAMHFKFLRLCLIFLF